MQHIHRHTHTHTSTQEADKAHKANALNNATTQEMWQSCKHKPGIGLCRHKPSVASYKCKPVDASYKHESSLHINA